MSRVNGLVLLHFGRCALLDATPALTGRPRWPASQMQRSPNRSAHRIDHLWPGGIKADGRSWTAAPGRSRRSRYIPGGDGEEQRSFEAALKAPERLLCRP